MNKYISRKESYVGFTILMGLVVIAIGVYLKQFHYDPSVFMVSLSKEEAASGSASPIESSPQNSGLQDVLPAGIKPLASAEFFGSDNLSDKIDGKAELYLSAGFVSLRSQRFALNEKPGSWMEIYVYDMGDNRNAFAVYGTQKRSDAEKADFAQFAYGTENALFFVNGKQYVEIVASDTSPELRDSMFSFARNLIRKTEPEAAVAAGLKETELFPKEHLDEGSIVLLPADVFGFSRLNNTYKANYSLGENGTTAFLSLRQTPQEASELSAAYHGFLIENGGSDVGMSVDIPGAKLVEIFDMYELIFSGGRLLGGVHEAGNKANAEKLGLMLYQRLSEVPD